MVAVSILGVWVEGWAWVGLEAAVVAGGGGGLGRGGGVGQPCHCCCGFELDSQMDCVNQTQIMQLLLEWAMIEPGSG